MRTLAAVLFLFLFSGLNFAQVIPQYSAIYSAPVTNGYYFFTPYRTYPVTGLKSQNLIVDGRGRAVYKRDSPDAVSGDFKLHANGLMSFSRQGKFWIMDSTFTIIDSIIPVNGITYDGHDLQFLPNGNVVILGSEVVVMDLSSYNYFGVDNSNPGSPSATVKCGVIQELDHFKNVVFEWHCKDHYNFAEVDPEFLSDPTNVDWTHLNAVEMDTDGNYLLSVRHFNEVTKINRSTGNITWRLGGNANQFSFVNDQPMFIGQHDCRRIANGNLTIFDNGRQNPFHIASAKEYKLNETALTASLVWSQPEIHSACSNATGNHQRLKNGNSLVNFGIVSSQNLCFQVFDPQGKVVFDLQFKDTLRTYRAFFYPALPWDLHRPLISCSATGGTAVLDAGGEYAGYQWSNGATSRTISVSDTGTYSVWVPKGNGGFIRSEDYRVGSKEDLCATAGIVKSAIGSHAVFPNPCGNLVKIRIDYSERFSDIKLTTIEGLTLDPKIQIGEQDILLDMSEFPPGIYLLCSPFGFHKIIKM
jgi:hypothetical protein